METPLGLTYTPFFPILQGFYRQQEQQEQLAAKAAEEQRKTAETRVYNAVADASKFHPDRPYVHSIEPYFQKQAQTLFDLSSQVKAGRVDPSALYEHMSKMNLDADAAKRYDNQVGTFKKTWKESGDFNMEDIELAYGNHTYDLTSTQALGVATLLPPFATDPNGFVNTVVTGAKYYNKAALSEKFIANLAKTEQEELEKFNASTNTSTSVKKFKSQFFSGSLGSSGQQVLDLGPIDGDQSRVLLNRFRNMSVNADNYLQLRTAEDHPDVKPGTPEWGIAMQESLQSLMLENGYLGESRKENALKPDKPDYDNSYIGGSAKTHANAERAADVIHRIIVDKDDSALSFLRGGTAISSAQFSPDGQKIVIKPKEGKVEVLATLMASMNSDMKDLFNPQTGVYEVPLSRNNVAELINIKNQISSKGDWVAEDVEIAYDQKFGKESATKTTAGVGLGLAADAVDLFEGYTPTAAEVAEFEAGAPPGTKYYIRDKNNKPVLRTIPNK